MLEKISMEKFLDIKRRLRQIIDEYESESSLSELNDESEIEKKYYQVQCELLNYDLSDIPFEAWEGVSIISPSNELFDLSKTKANLDFNIVEVDGYCRYNGCNVKNIDKLKFIFSDDVFDSKVIEDNPNCFLSDNFSEEYKRLFYTKQLTIEHYFRLNPNQVSELKQKYELRSNNSLYRLYGLDRTLEIYHYSKDVYDLVLYAIGKEYKYDFYIFRVTGEEQALLSQVSNADVSELRKICNDYIKLLIINYAATVNIDKLPTLFVQDNPELLLLNTSIPEEVRQRYYNHELSFDDVIEYHNVFPDIPLDKFFKQDLRYDIELVSPKIGFGNIQKLLIQYPVAVTHLFEKENIRDFAALLDSDRNYDDAFCCGIRKYIIKRFSNLDLEKKYENYKDDLKWIESVNIKFIKSIEDGHDFALLDNKTIILNNAQRDIIEELGIDNIKKFDTKTNFFSRYFDMQVQTNNVNHSMLHVFFNVLGDYLKFIKDPKNIGHIPFNGGTISYIDFEDEMAKFIGFLRKTSFFTSCPDYDWIKGSFRDEHPEIFMDEHAPYDLKEAFYHSTLFAKKLFGKPEYIPYLLDKDLNECIIVESDVELVEQEQLMLHNVHHDFASKYLSLYGKKKFLELLCKYGNGIHDGLIIDQENIDINNEAEVEKSIRDQIYERIRNNHKFHYEFLIYCPEFVNEHPNMFLSPDAPYLLKEYFYGYSNVVFNFVLLSEYPDWLPFLKDKDIVYAMSRNQYTRESIEQYFELFGIEKGLKLGISRDQTINEMIESHQVELLKKWYDKTGGRFIPDYVVMSNIHFEEADKFLANGTGWSRLMQINSFAEDPEAREAMLKLAYVFGVFEGDSRGLKKTIELFSELPKTISPQLAYIINNLDDYIDKISKREEIDPQLSQNKKYDLMRRNIKNTNNILGAYVSNYEKIIIALEQDNYGIDLTKSIIRQLYRLNQDGSYVLSFSAQSYPKLAQALRNLLENYQELPIITPRLAHILFGGFVLRYDPDFREFMLANIDKISDIDSFYVLTAIQKQFPKIKAVNSNRALTWERALDYVRTNKYENINVGNERASEIVAYAGYSQEDWEILQQIYNYGKQRVSSSIPRVNKTVGDYYYEIIRLDDPLALAIGPLTNCCQELHNCAELCMEHSMTDKNGRLFVIKDAAGNIIAQSWVWRNKDVLCFDNIEIPDKAFERALKKDIHDFVTVVYNLYEDAAAELMEEDERVYKELLDKKMITQEQFDGLRLGKVTVGLGFNDIAFAIQKYAEIDKEILSRPLLFNAPVPLTKGLYISDSKTQYVIKKRDDRVEYDGETLPVHFDTFEEYDDSNFNGSLLHSLNALEMATRPNNGYYATNFTYENNNNLVSLIANEYHLNPNTTRVILHSNFAIIYDTFDDNIVIGDLLYNLSIDNHNQTFDIKKSVILQLRLALDQISRGKRVNISNLDPNQQDIYNLVMGINMELYEERGVGNAK